MRTTLRRRYNISKEKLLAAPERRDDEQEPETKNQAHPRPEQAVRYPPMGHGHIKTSASYNKRGLKLVFGMTAAYLVVEIIGGVLTHSLALLADAGHMLTDVAGVHDLRVWTLTSGVNAMSTYVVLADGAARDSVLAAVQGGVTSDFKIAHATVQVQMQGCEEHETHL
jgi:Co/Zn/Cd efflux system component